MHWPGKLSNQLFSQLIMFALVGMLATLTHLGTLIFLVEGLRCPVLPATTTGFTLAVLVSYYLNSRWTFGLTRGHRRHLPRYVLVCITGLILNSLVMLVTVVLMHWWYVAGQLAALAVVPISNFMLSRYWVFTAERLQTFFVPME